jgi:PhoH-like ATPase
LSERKKFVLDTSVLLYDKKSIHSFPGNDVIIPLVVLDELDRFKDRSGVIGENARYVNRYLDKIRKSEESKICDGVKIEGDQTIQVLIDNDLPKIEGLEPTYGDNQIILLAHKISKKDNKVIVVTKDINFRVKCDSLGINAEDYYKDNIALDASHYTGVKEVDVEDEIVDEIHENKKVNLYDVDFDINPNEFYILKSKENPKKSAICVAKMGERSLVLVEKANITSTNLVSKNKEQLFALNLLSAKDVPLVTIEGIAGSGKTFLTLMSAVSECHKGNYRYIVLTRPIQSVGKDLGFLPGDVDDKMSVWIQPIIDNFKSGLGDITWFYQMKDKGQIEVAPLPFVRGRTFSDAFIIVDEAQNATIHELKTLITRVGENSKIVLLGDTDQIDTPYIDKLSNGLSVVIDKFKESEHSGHITLSKGVRSNLATFASKVL